MKALPGCLAKRADPSAFLFSGVGLLLGKVQCFCRDVYKRQSTGFLIQPEITKGIAPKQLMTSHESAVVTKPSRR